jgi:hypothetical protein
MGILTPEIECRIVATFDGGLRRPSAKLGGVGSHKRLSQGKRDGAMSEDIGCRVSRNRGLSTR